jgi:hypothetical protein
VSEDKDDRDKEEEEKEGEDAGEEDVVSTAEEGCVGGESSRTGMLNGENDGSDEP